MVIGTLSGWALYKINSTSYLDPVYQVGLKSSPIDHSVPPLVAQDTRTVAEEWRHYGKDAGGSRFSTAAQITIKNIKNLEPVWTYRTGPSPKGFVTFQATPIKIGQLLYFCTGYNDVIALNADSGEEVWRYRPKVDTRGVAALTCRGVAYYRVPGAVGACAERIYTNTLDARLIAIDALDGGLCNDFGVNGEVSLLRGMGEVTPGYYYATSAPTIANGKIVLGGWVTDGQYWGEPSGVIRAFDAITGGLAWAFDMGRPDLHGEPAAGEQYTRSTPNSWAPMSVDEELNLVFVPTGNATPDYYGAYRREFDDKYSSSVIALDANTGEVRWSFQTVHHDLWDYDVASQPTLIDWPTMHGVRKALVQATKTGEIFVLDRVTGEPIMPIEERSVPQGGVPPEEKLSKTQPYSVAMPSFRGPNLTERSMWGLTPIDQLWCRIRFRSARYEGPFTPIGQQWTIMSPGSFGGVNWGSVSVDPSRLIMVVASNRMAQYSRLITREEAKARGMKTRDEYSTEIVGGPAPQENTPFAADAQMFFSPLQIPCQQPPYGVLTGVDLATGQVVWHRTLGTAQDSGPFNVRLGLKIPIGPPSAGGAITTAGGITFIAASQDAYLRAFDTNNGVLLWERRLPAGGQATPMTYMSDTGRQMLVVAAGGTKAFKTKIGDYVVAFALTEH